MSEFKGTKGEWKADYGGEITSNNSFICDCATLTEEDRYNAQLISCAPEVLEELGTSTSVLESLLHLFGDNMAMSTKFGVTSQIEKNKDLITKATTI